MRDWLLNSTALKAPEGDGAAPPADTTPPAQSTPQETPSQIRELLDFDPFEPELVSGQDEGANKTAAPSPPAGGEKKKVGDDKIPPSDADPTPPKPDPVAQQLEQVAHLLRQQTEAAARPKPEAEKGPKAPKFNLSIPESITKALLTSEEPTERAAALAEFANGLSNLVYDETMKEVRANLAEIVRRIPDIAKNQVTELTTQQEMQRDFWDNVSGAQIPEAQRLPRTREMGQFVALTAQSLALELKSQGKDLGWTPEFRNEVVKRVYAGLGRQAPGTTPVPAQKPNGQLLRQPKTPAFATGAGQRAGDQVAYKSDVEKEIAEMFD